MVWSIAQTERANTMFTLSQRNSPSSPRIGRRRGWGMMRADYPMAGDRGLTFLCPRRGEDHLCRLLRAKHVGVDHQVVVQRAFVLHVVKPLEVSLALVVGVHHRL